MFLMPMTSRRFFSAEEPNPPLAVASRPPRLVKKLSRKRAADISCRCGPPALKAVSPAPLSAADRALAGYFKFSNMAMMAACKLGRALYVQAGNSANLECHTVRYGDKPWQTAEVHRPRGDATNLPMVLYAHGGGFAMMGPESHWSLAMPFAKLQYAGQLGHVVLLPRYGLTPEHRFPTALEDLCKATEWALDHGREYGGDPTNMILAGDSAGGNLVAALTACMCYERPESYARSLYQRKCVPRAVLPHAGTFQMTDLSMLYDALPKWAPRGLVWPIVRAIEWYLGEPEHRPSNLDLANPLRVFEQGSPSRPLPPFSLSIGTQDPLMPETLKFAEVLRDKEVTLRVNKYDAGHVFHMATDLTAEARRFWVDTRRDLEDFALERARSAPRPSR